MSKYSRGEKGEEIVANILAKIPANHLLINNLMLEDKKGGTHQLDHILIMNKGIFVIETKNYYGDISDNANDSIWFKKVGNKTEMIANPLHQNSSHIRIIKEILKGKNYEYISCVVFVKNNAPYLPDDNVINLKDLELFIESYPNSKTLSNEEMFNIYNVLLYAESDVQKDDHLKNIKGIRDRRNERQKEIRQAVETRICPRCKSKLIETSSGLICSNKKCHYKIEF